MAKRQWLALLVLLWAATTPQVILQAELMGPGTYHGFFQETRWGQQVVHLGPYHLFVSESVGHALENHLGAPLELMVSDFSLITGKVEEVAEVSKKGLSMGLILSAEIEQSEVPFGQGIRLHLSLRNESNTSITLKSDQLAIVLATNSQLNADIGYQDPNDRAYWYYRYGYRSFDPETPPTIIACHEIRLSPIDKAQGGPVPEFRAIDPKGGFPEWLTLNPQEKIEASYVLGEALLPDDYEVFFYLRSGNLSSIAGPMSSRLAFDVEKRATDDPGGAAGEP